MEIVKTGTSKSPKVQAENLEEIKSTLRKEILWELTKNLANNQKEMLRLIAIKQTTTTVPDESDSESEIVSPTLTSTPMKSKTTATTQETTPINSRNINLFPFKIITAA